MSSHPTPQEATDALRDVDRRTGQAVGSLRTAPRWLDVFFGIVFLLYGASSDFLPGSITWANWILVAIVVVYSLLLRSRRGAALLGQPARVRRAAMSSGFVVGARLVIGVILVGSIVAILILGAHHANTHVPYLSTIFGVVAAIAMIGFGPQLRAGMAGLATRRAGSPDGRP